MIKKLLALLVVSGALAAAAHADTVTFSPSAQTVSAGDTATVDVYLSASEVIGGFQFLVLNDASILTPTAVTYYSNLGLDFPATTLGAGSTNAFDVSLDDSATLASLQSTQPFALFQISYLAIGPGTSSLDLSNDIKVMLTDVDGNALPNPDYVAGSITVRGGTPPPPPTVPEPSTFVLLGTGGTALITAVRRRLQAAVNR